MEDPLRHISPLQSLSASQTTHSPTEEVLACHLIVPSVRKSMKDNDIGIRNTGPTLKIALLPEAESDFLYDDSLALGAQV